MGRKRRADASRDRHEPVSGCELLVRARHDPEAFGVFFDHHYDAVLRFFGSRVRGPEAATDLCAETFAQALLVIDRFDPDKGSATQWLFGIAKNLLHRFWRDIHVDDRARKALSMRRIAVDDATAEALERLNASVGTNAAISTALAALPIGQAEAVCLRIVHELPYPDVAARLGCRVGAARVRVHRGLEAIRDHLEREGW